MGKRAREERKKTKAFLRQHGFIENELGELRYKGTKAQARKRAAQDILRQYHTESWIIATATKRAMDDITALEDARVLAELGSLAGAANATPIVPA